MSSFKSLNKYVGVFFYDSESRKDKCYYIRYKNLDGKLMVEKIGWASEGITPQQAQLIRNERIKAIRLGDEVVTIQAKRKSSLSLGEFFYKSYMPNNNNKSKKSCKLEEQLYEKWIKPIIGNKALKNITPFDLERIKKTMKDAGKSPRTINYALAVIRQGDIP